MMSRQSKNLGTAENRSQGAKKWFKGYSAPYLDRTPATSMKWPAQVWGYLRGGDSERRKAGKRYIAVNITPLASATRRFLTGGVSERRLVEELATCDANGWAVAGANAHLEAIKQFRGEDASGAGTGWDTELDSHRTGPDDQSTLKSQVGGRLTAAQQERERARREEAERAARAMELAKMGTPSASDDDTTDGVSDKTPYGSTHETSLDLCRDDVDTLFRAFKNFRDNVDLMAMRDGAVDDAFVFEILLEDMEI